MARDAAWRRPTVAGTRHPQAERRKERSFCLRSSVRTSWSGSQTCGRRQEGDRRPAPTTFKEAYPAEGLSSGKKPAVSGKKSCSCSTRPIQPSGMRRIWEVGRSGVSAEGRSASATAQWPVRRCAGDPAPPLTITLRGRTGIDRVARGFDCVSWLVGRPREKSTVLQLPKLSLLWLLN